MRSAVSNELVRARRNGREYRAAIVHHSAATSRAHGNRMNTPFSTITARVSPVTANPSSCFCQSMIHVKPERTIDWQRSEEHTSELQSHLNLVCRLLLEKKK